jgi:hypothetical protein
MLKKKGLRVTVKPYGQPQRQKSFSLMMIRMEEEEEREL